MRATPARAPHIRIPSIACTEAVVIEAKENTKMPLEPIDILIKIRAVAGNGMLTAADRFARIEAMIAEGRALSSAPAEAPPAEPEAPARRRRGPAE